MQQKRSVTFNQVKQYLLKTSKQVSQNIHELTKHLLQILQLLQKKNVKIINRQQLTPYLKKHIKYQKTVTPKQLCAKILKKDQLAFRCLQCQSQQSSVLCIQCFKKSNHVGHNFKQSLVNGGCCDCGDDQKWDVKGFCSDHVNNQVNYKINQKQTTQFIKQLKFLLLLIILINHIRIHEWRQAHDFVLTLMQALLSFFLNFNQDSLISNQMTFLLLKDNLQAEQKSFKEHKLHITIPFKLVIEIFWSFEDDASISLKLTNLWILLFPLKGFKKYLTNFYINLVLTKPKIFLSQARFISCQIFTSYKILGQLLQQNNMRPIEITTPIKNINKFQIIANIYDRYYLDFMYFTKLSHGVNQQYIDFHLNEGNIVRYSGYQMEAKKFQHQAMSYYFIQYFMLFHLVKLIPVVSSHKQTLKKSIQDLINYIIQQPTTQSIRFFIPKQRSLYLFLYQYCDGKIQQATTKQFLKSINLTYQTLYKILQSVLHVIRFDALHITNYQTTQKHSRYYIFTFYRPHILISIDFQLLKFCLLALSNLDKERILYQRQFFDQSLGIGVDYQDNLTFQNNAMPIDNLMALPTKFIETYLKNGGSNADSIYDRKKALGILTGYIGLLHELILFNHSSINIKILLGMTDVKQMIEFYGRLLRKLQNTKLEDFKIYCEIWLGGELLHFEQFVKEYCEIENKKIRLKSSKQHQFIPINLLYIKSMQPLKARWQAMEQKCKQSTFQQLPESDLQENIKLVLINTIFNQYFVKNIITNTYGYLTILKQKQQLLKTDLPHFTQFLEQLIKLNYTLKNKQIHYIFISIFNQQLIFKQLPDSLKKQIKQINGIFSQNVSNTEKTHLIKQELDKKKSIAMKKIQKLKSKQCQILEKYNQSLQTQQQKQQTIQQHYFCMFCKSSHIQKPLYILCFEQKSNLFSKQYLNSQQCTSFVTSCGHFAHVQCILKNNNILNHCNFCKNYYNSLLKAAPQNTFKNKQDGNLDTLNQINIKKPTITISDIAIYILYGALVDYSFFVQSLANVCCFALNALPSSEFNNKETLFSISPQNQQITAQPKFWNAYKFTIKAIVSMFMSSFNEDNYFINKRKQQESIGQELSNFITHILKWITKPQNLSNLSKAKLTALHPPTMKQLPLDLSILSKQIYICPQCKRTTNQIAICLLCPYKSCIRCKKINLTKHALSEHMGSSIYVRVDQGIPYYVAPSICGQFPGIYKNIIGEIYEMKKVKTKADFILNQEDYNKIKNDLIRHRVQQEIQYSKLMDDKSIEIVNYQP